MVHCRWLHLLNLLGVHIKINYLSVRWVQPDQQHGRRLPTLSSGATLVICFFLVSSFLTETVQQIHSLRASGVIFSQATKALESAARAFRKSAGGNVCTVPPEIFMIIIPFCWVSGENRTLDTASTGRSFTTKLQTPSYSALFNDSLAPLQLYQTDDWPV